MPKTTIKFFTERVYFWISNQYDVYQSIAEYADYVTDDVRAVANYTRELVLDWALCDTNNNLFATELITDYLDFVDWDYIAGEMLETL